MTPKQQQFKDELIGSIAFSERYLRFWDFEKRELLIDEVQQAESYLSDGETQMLYFLANVWLGENKYPFDLFYSAGKLDEHNKAVIAEWLKNPLWP